MDLNVGEAFEVTDGRYCGIFRILARDSAALRLGIIQATVGLVRKPGPKSKVLVGDAQAPISNTTVILKLTNADFRNLISQGIVEPWEMEIPNSFKQYGETRKEEWDKRIKVMELFLDPINLEDSLLRTSKCTQLIKKTIDSNKIARKEVLKYLNLLILYGFVKEALIPQHHKKGAPNKLRANLSNQKKAGRKSNVYIDALINNRQLPKEGPAMNMDIINKIHDYIANASLPHPSMRKMWIDVLETQFLVTTKDENGKLLAKFVSEHEYPTYRQFHYYVNKHYDDQGRQIFRTTSSNKRLNHRATLGRNDYGVPGPGHTYTIDSTVADVFLVHHSNRDKPIGRPIVYVVVDVYSGAVVGYHTCLTGPNWETAKISLFCSAYDPEKMARIRGLKYKACFKHKPKLPKIALSDRGEVFSREARKTAFQINMDQAIAALQRGDWKSNSEVKFRTIKDEFFAFVPGSFDARREEFELCSSEPNAAVMSMREFTEYLYSFFHEFNNRVVEKDRIPKGMELEDILPTRAAIWDWGHEMYLSGGIHMSDDQLVEELLPKYKATALEDGISLGVTPRRYYGDIDNERDLRICDDAKAGISIEIDAWAFPGCIDHIWTNDGCITGLREIPLLGKDFTYLTEDEYEDIQYVVALNRSKHSHAQTELSVLEHHDRKNIVKKAQAKTDAHVRNNPRKPKPNVKENRENEIGYMVPTAEVTGGKVSAEENAASCNSGHMSPDDFIKQFLLGNGK